MVYVAVTMLRRGMTEEPPAEVAAVAALPEPTGRRGTMLERLSGEGYRVRRLGLGVVGATFAGVVSALLGHRRRDRQGAADERRDGRARCASRPRRAT